MRWTKQRNNFNFKHRWKCHQISGSCLFKSSNFGEEKKSARKWFKIMLICLFDSQGIIRRVCAWRLSKNHSYCPSARLLAGFESLSAVTDQLKAVRSSSTLDCFQPKYCSASSTNLFSVMTCKACKVFMLTCFASLSFVL